MQKLGRWQKMDDAENRKLLEVIASSIGMTCEQMEQMINNLNYVKDSGYGKVSITVKKGKIYNLAFTIEQEPEKL